MRALRIAFTILVIALLCIYGCFVTVVLGIASIVSGRNFLMENYRRGEARMEQWAKYARNRQQDR